tara:strand:+ start:1797 stop:3038 length:1242 start_codon:yes stop_codon:yes gene_type:complete
MAIRNLQNFLQSLGQRVGTGFERMGATTDPTLSPEAQRLAGIQNLSQALRRTGATLSGDPQRMALQAQEDEALRQRRLAEDQKRRLNQFLASPEGAKYRGMGELLGTQSLPLIAQDVFKGESQRRIVKGADGFNYYEDTGERVFPSVDKPPKGATNDPLRTITEGGKVVKNVRDSELTTEEILKINQSGQVIQPLGFTEKFESSKDVDFAPIKSKYLATQNIIIKTTELAQKFANEPTSALAIGPVTEFVDSIIQNIDAAGDLLSNAQDKKAYKYMQETSTSLEGKDFTDAIQQASKASGVAGSRIRDLAYLFAAARGQEGRGLSDKDYENALKIVTGGVGVAGRSAVLKDVADGLRSEFYRDIDFDIATSENNDYVNKLKALPELPSFAFPVSAQQTTTETSDGKKRVRITL